MTVSVV